MKRYGLVNASDFDGNKAKLIEDEDGEWVKFEDVIGDVGVNILKAKVRGLEKKIDRIEDHCNCREASNRLKNPQSISDLNAYWICPIHGYKRI